MSEAAQDARAFEENDRRKLGDWSSRFPISAWVQIGLELLYLLIILLGCAAVLLWIGYVVAPPASADARAFSPFGIQVEYPRDRTILIWLSVALSGMVGGSCFALKWLYHSVAKKEWNRDRLVWRLIVPLLSGAVAVSVSLLVASGVIALLDPRFFSSFYGAVGAGWLIGYFSDNVLAALRRLADRWFGRVDEPGDSGGTKPTAREQA
jgi:hypothetical protein